MLIRQIVKSIDHPTETNKSGDPITFTIRRLNRKQRKKASDARTTASLTRVIELGGAKAIKQLQSIEADPEARKQAEAEADKDPFNMFDMDAILAAGVVSWSYVDAESGAPVPVNDDTLAELDEETAEWLGGEIITFFKGEAEAKNA